MIFPIDHDLHCHTVLSACSNDPKQSVDCLLAHAKKCHYTVQCVTDHLWDSLVPGASERYAPQNVEHVEQNLPMPRDEQVRMVFGCEPEFCGGKKLSLHPSHFDNFDFIAIPPNHFHIIDFVRPACYDTEERIADLLVERLEELSLLDLPWKKVGIAHMTCRLIFLEGDMNKVFELVDEKRYRAVVHKFAQFGAGIELNSNCFAQNYLDHKEANLRLYRFAKEEGCKFYLGSDAHHPDALDNIPNRMADPIKELGLTDADLYRIP